MMPRRKLELFASTRTAGVDIQFSWFDCYGISPNRRQGRIVASFQVNVLVPEGARPGKFALVGPGS